MLLFVVAICTLFIVSSAIYLITKQLLQMKEQKRMPDEPENPNPGGDGGDGNDVNPNPGPENP